LAASSILFLNCDTGINKAPSNIPVSIS
jgi:hypothetical protein